MKILLSKVNSFTVFFETFGSNFGTFFGHFFATWSFTKQKQLKQHSFQHFSSVCGKKQICLFFSKFFVFSDILFILL